MLGDAAVNLSFRSFIPLTASTFPFSSYFHLVKYRRKVKIVTWRWMVLASCSFSRLSKEIENETHGGWWQQKTRTWNLHLLGDYIQMLLQYLSLVIQIHCLLIQCLRDYTEEFIGVEVSFTSCYSS